MDTARAFGRAVTILSAESGFYALKGKGFVKGKYSVKVKAG
jgi:hypothetical protein